MAATTILAGAAVVSAGVGVYSALNAPEAPNMPDAPPPASYYTYDEDGNLAGSQIWDASKNAYISKPAPLTAEQKAEKAKRQEIRNQMLANISGRDFEVQSTKYTEFNNQKDKLLKEKADIENNPSSWINIPTTPKYIWDLPLSGVTGAKGQKKLTPQAEGELKRIGEEIANIDNLLSSTPKNTTIAAEDRAKAYEEYAKTFSNVMHRDVDKRYQDIVRSTDESMEARGMTGSRAYADTIAQLARDKQTTDVDIAERSAFAKEQLAQQDRDYWLRTMAELDAGRSSDYANALQKQQASANAAQMGTAGIMAGYNVDTSNELRRWEAEMEKNAAMTNAFAGTAGTLGMAALMKDSKSPLQPSSSQAAGLSYLYGYNKPTFDYTKPWWMY